MELFLTMFFGVIGSVTALYGAYTWGKKNGKIEMKRQMQALLEEKECEIAKLKAKPTKFDPLPKPKNLRVC